MKTPTLQEFKRWSREHYQLAHAVCAATAFAQCQRERVDAYVQPIFERYGFEVSERFVERGMDRRITDIKRLYLTDLDAPEYLDFLDECHAAHRAHGFKGPHGHCPALVAEDLQRTAEHALISAGRELLGIEDAPLYGENRAKMLDLLMGACLKRDERRAA